MTNVIMIEPVQQWGQREEPPPRAFLRKTKGLWVQIDPATGYDENDPVGFYLGNNTVLALVPTTTC